MFLFPTRIEPTWGDHYTVGKLSSLILDQLLISNLNLIYWGKYRGCIGKDRELMLKPKVGISRIFTQLFDHILFIFRVFEIKAWLVARFEIFICERQIRCQ